MPDSSMTELLKASASIQAIPAQNMEGTLLPESALIASLNNIQQNPEASNIHVALLSLIEKDLPAQQRLEEDAYLLIYLIDICFELFSSATPLEDDVMQQFFRFRPILAQLAIQDSQWLDRPEHFIYSMLNEISLFYIGWDPHNGRASQMSLNKLSSAMDSLSNHNALDITQVKFFWSNLRGELKKEQDKFTKLVNRICQTEEASIKVRKAQSTATLYLNKLTHKKELPTEVTVFLQNDWLQAMQTILRDNGSKSEEWDTMRKLTTNLIWSSIPSTVEADLQKKFSIIPKLMDLLKTQLFHLTSDEDKEKAVAPLDSVFYQILKQEAPNTEVVKALDSHTLTDEASVSVSKALIKKVAQFKRGSWFLWHEKDKTIRCMLASIMPELEEVLFVNRSGGKSLQVPLEKFAYKHSIKEASLLPNERPFSIIYLEFTKQLVQNYFTKEDADTAAEEENRLRLEQEKQAKKLASEKAAKEAAAIEKAQQEAEKKALQEQQEKKEQERQSALEAEEEEQQAQEQEAREILNSIDLGDWVEMEKNSAVIQCKLSLKMKSSDKFIFTDKNGLKTGEYRGASELIPMILKKRFRLLSNDNDSGNSLTRIIGSIRGD